MTTSSPDGQQLCANCRRPVTKHRPWCQDVQTTEPPQAGDIVDHPLLGRTALISVYSRREAIEDGTLVDCMQDPFDDLNRNAGVVYDVAMTNAAFHRYVEVSEQFRGSQDIKGRYWDVILMFSLAARRNPESSELLFEFVCLPNGSGYWTNEQRAEGPERRLVQLKAVSGPGDYGEPCLTLMLPNED
jgi:hypothetical protein